MLKRTRKRYEKKAYEDPRPLVEELENKLHTKEGKEIIQTTLWGPTFGELYDILRKRLMDKERPLKDEQLRTLLIRRTKLVNYARVYIEAGGTPAPSVIGVVDKDQAFGLFQAQYERFISQYRVGEKEKIPSDVLRHVQQMKYNQIIVNYYEPRSAEAFKNLGNMIHITKPYEPPTLEDPEKFRRRYGTWKAYYYTYHSFALDSLFNVRIRYWKARMYKVSGARSKMSYARMLRWRKPAFVACAAFLTLLENFIDFCQTTIYGEEELRKREKITKKFRDILGPYNKYLMRYLKVGEKFGHINGWMAQHEREKDLRKYAEPFAVMEEGDESVIT